MRALVVRTVPQYQRAVGRRGIVPTLSDIDVTPRETVKGGKRSIHINTMLKIHTSVIDPLYDLATYRIQDLPECFELSLYPVLVRDELL